MDNLKENIISVIDNMRDELVLLAKNIHENPEISSQEYKTCKLLCEYLKDKGFKVESGIANLDTAFKADFYTNAGVPQIGFLAEYDALPEIGHGCGHNLIAPASIGAALALKELVSEKVNIGVIGTPAEETTGGKLPMIEKGTFNGYDVLMMFHPHVVTNGHRPCIGRVSLVFEFFGAPAHASSFPDKGINALDAVIATFNNINALRQQLREDVRIHGIITHGGEVTNIIPEYARAEFFVRANEKTYMDEVTAKVKKCAEGAALATGTKLKTSSNLPTYLPDIPVGSLIDLFEKNLEELGLEIERVKPPFRLGSSDYGNVSQIVPSVMGFIKIAPANVATHSKEFAEAASSPIGYEAMLNAAKAMAMTAINIIQNPRLLDTIKHEFIQGGGKA